MTEFKISNIFSSVQGEGPLMGRKAIFVRFAGCNLDCNFCDTPEAKRKENIFTFTTEQICERIYNMLEHWICDYIVFTGGEPLLQPIHKIAGKILETKDINFGIETNGTQDVFKFIETCEEYFSSIHVSISPKVKRSKLKIDEAYINDDLCSTLKLLYPYLPGCTPENFDDYPVSWKGIQPILRDKNCTIELYEDVLQELKKIGPDWNLSFQAHKFIGFE